MRPVKYLKLVLFITFSVSLVKVKAQSVNLYVATTGSDNNPGTKEKPFHSLQKAKKVVRKVKSGQPIHVFLRKGIYYLRQTLHFGPGDSGNEGAPVIYEAYPGEKVTLSGARRLAHLKWVYWKHGIYKAKVPDSIDFDQFFVNGKRQIRARFPNYDYENPLRGGNGYQLAIAGSNKRYDTWMEYDSAVFSDKKWSIPSTGILHAFQSHSWGNLEYHIKEIDRSNNRILLGKGGWQLQRRYGIGKGSPFFVANIFEELDAPGEWFLNKEQATLYYYPTAGIQINKAVVEAVVLKNLINFKGNAKTPVSYIKLRGFDFTQARMTFMDAYEPLGRGDWAIHRGGAIFMEGVQDCAVEDCNFAYVGGNGVFMSKYNRRNVISGCRFYHIGESAVCFVGDTAAVRGYMTWDDRDIYHKDWEDMGKDMDFHPGPKNPDYPEDCEMRNCIAYELGDFGKQVAGVLISMSHRVTVSHCTIYDVPRAAICINDGTWGGHIIEYCNIWNTVRETGEHGPFNAWGRSRYWRGDGHTIKTQVLLDAMDPTIVRYNRIANFRKSVSAGNWTIDLDDGSSNYEIYNNLSLGSTLKLRDGYYRKVWNNIFISAVPIGWHVWPKGSGDEFYHNVVVIAGVVPGQKKPTKVFIRPIKMPTGSKWGRKVEKNLYYNANYKDPLVCPGVTITEWQKKGYDRHSLFIRPLFIDPKKGDYRVKAHSPALKIGFVNFPMDRFGHTMTRIVPFGGAFESEVLITLKPDARGGKVYYTLDGTDPSLESILYTGPFEIIKTDTVRAQTFKGGIPVGFQAKAVFTKVKKVVNPSWYETLLNGTPSSSLPPEEKQHGKAVLEWEGASLMDISDGDMIDAMGGFTTGVFMDKVPLSSEAYHLGFRSSDIMIAVNGRKINNTEEFKELLGKKSGREFQFTLVRGYKQLTLKFKSSEVKK